MSNQLADLTDSQSRLLKEFYSQPLMSSAMRKTQRLKIWKDFIETRSLDTFAEWGETFPSITKVLKRALELDLNLQPAIISECIFAESLAKIFEIQNFYIFEDDKNLIPKNTLDAIAEKNLVPRFFYTNDDLSKILFQAGGSGGVDAGLVDVASNKVFAIEFKESYAKASEPDLPPYDENGYLILDDPFKVKHPQFVSMIEEQLKKELNVFESIGHNVNVFSPESILQAVNENYLGIKFADVLVTENASSQIAMLPVNHASRWAKLEGEIRTAGKNYYKLWTKTKLIELVRDLGGSAEGDLIKVPKSKLGDRKGRGSGGKVTGKKITSLFFAKVTDVNYVGEFAEIPIDKVLQLRPTITAKMDFRKMKPEELRQYYLDIINQ